MRLFEIDESKGSYASVKFNEATTKALAEYQEKISVPVALEADEFHSTVMFSRKFVPDFKELGEGLDWNGEFTGFEIFPSDDDNALVLTYSCPELEERFEYITNEYGATWDHDDFIPHITLSYNVGDLDPASLPAYDGPITIISESGDDLDLEWVEDKK